LADGFSCRQQIEQTTDRRGLHIAQLAHLAMQQEEQESDGPSAYPERDYLDRNRPARGASPRSRRRLWITGLIALGLGLYFMRRRGQRKSIAR
jgi:hypothetical protein